MSTILEAGRRARRKSGLTLIELAIAVTLLAAMFIAVALTAGTASDAYHGNRIDENLASQAHRTLDGIAEDLAEALRASLDPEPDPVSGTETLRYTQSLGWADGALLQSALQRISLELETAEQDNGLDDNGNGLVDEGVIVWTENPGLVDERRVIRSHWVREYLEGELPNGLDDNGNGLRDERGLCFSIEGDVLTIRITLERRDDDGRIHTKTVQTSVRVRN